MRKTLAVSAEQPCDGKREAVGTGAVQTRPTDPTPITRGAPHIPAMRNVETNGFAARQA